MRVALRFLFHDTAAADTVGCLVDKTDTQETIKQHVGGGGCRTKRICNGCNGCIASFRACGVCVTASLSNLFLLLKAPTDGSYLLETIIIRSSVPAPRTACRSASLALRILPCVRTFANSRTTRRQHPGAGLLLRS